MDVFSPRSLMQLHTMLFLHFGDPRWWPGETPFEVAVGAVLTQNTAWTNVEKAIKELKRADLLDPERMLGCPPDVLARLVRSAGYHNQKAGYLRSLSSFIVSELHGDIASLAGSGAEKAREMLLRVRGIGNETADSILCYAASEPVFVVDAYTIRIFERMAPPDLENDGKERTSEYMKVRSMVMDMKADNMLYNRFHALLVLLGKEYCRKRPLCMDCPVRDMCFSGRTSR